MVRHAGVEMVVVKEAAEAHGSLEVGGRLMAQGHTGQRQVVEGWREREPFPGLVGGMSEAGSAGQTGLGSTVRVILGALGMGTAPGYLTLALGW